MYATSSAVDAPAPWQLADLDGRGLRRGEGGLSSRDASMIAVLIAPRRARVAAV